MKANRKFVEGREAVSAVIGVILMVAITVAIAAAVYVYISGMLTGSPTVTPTVSLSASESGKNCTISIGQPSEANIKWSDVSYTLVNLTSGETITFNDNNENSSYALKITLPTGTIKGGQVISIKCTDTSKAGLKSDNKYRFTLVYDKTGGTMGIAEWTQP